MEKSQKQFIESLEEVSKFQEDEIFKAEAKRAASKARGFAFERRKRLPYLLQKGLAKPGRISHEVLRRAAASVYAARICVNVLKEKVTKTAWTIQPVDPLRKVDPKRIKEVEDFFKNPNKNTDTLRSFLDKSLEDLLVLDVVAWEKTRYPDGKLAELHYVDAASIRPVFDEYGNQDVEIELKNEKNEVNKLPVSYVQIFDSNQYGGPESGELVAAWPKKDFIYFSMHPQGAMGSFGYGLSPIEAVIGVVSNILSADNFNAQYFEEGSFPPIILQLQEQMDQRELESMREYLYGELEGRFHRPAVVAGAGKMEVMNLKDISQRDMQFMQYMEFMSKMLAAAYGLSPQDIGLTDDINRATAEVQKDLSQAKGYGSILGLLKEIFNQEIIAKDFGYDDIQFDWVAPDTEDPKEAMNMYQTALQTGAMTLNEVRKKLGETPYGSWADQPAVLGTDGYHLIGEPQEKKPEANPDNDVAGEKPYKEQAEDELKKSVFTYDAQFRCWADDRGVGQPFIFVNVLTGKGWVIKPPVAVNLFSQKLEEEWTKKLAAEGLNVSVVKRMTEPEIRAQILSTLELNKEFDAYQNMLPQYDSEKWRSKFGGSRRYPYYLVSEYVDGRALTDNLLQQDMMRDPDSYFAAIEDLAKLWTAEKKYILGDRRADQIIITPDKRAFAFDYQFVGNEGRWKGTKDAYAKTLDKSPKLKERFLALTGQDVSKSLIKKIFRK